MRKKGFLDIVSLALLVPAFGFAAYRLSPQFRASVLVVAGRAPNCPLRWAVKSDQMIRDHVALMNHFVETSTLVKEEQGLKLWHTQRGDYWMPGGDKDVLMSLLSEQDHQIYGKGEQGVHPGDIVLDCGAHVGVFTRVALKAGAKLVVSIEPAPKNLECLRRKLATENRRRQSNCLSQRSVGTRWGSHFSRRSRELRRKLDGIQRSGKA